MTLRIVPLVGVAAITFMNSACLATRKHVRNQIAPVQAQLNTVEKQTADNKQAIGDLDRTVASVDEKATQAGNDAGAAADTAQIAGVIALHATQRAADAQLIAENTANVVDATIRNLDNYRLVENQQLFFRINRSELSPAGRRQLDRAIAHLSNVNTYVIEVEGFADRSGGTSSNLTLSQNRADTVARYLRLHGVPLRKIRVVGLGTEDPNTKTGTRVRRSEERRVDVRVYALDINGLGSTAMRGASDRMITLPSNAEMGDGAQ